MRKNDKFSIIRDNKRLLETYQNIRTRIWIKHPQMKVISVLSGDVNKFKTEFALNLAQAYASPENKVLLLDGNFKNSQIVKSMNLKAADGFEEVLRDQVKVDQSIHETQTLNMDLLPVITPCKNSSELLETSKLIEIIDELRFKYDVIIVDTPSLSLTLDGLILGKYSDGSIFVAEKNQTKRTDVEHYSDLMSEAGVNLIGSIFIKD